jgi:hypothetical protein
VHVIQHDALLRNEKQIWLVNNYRRVPIHLNWKGISQDSVLEVTVDIEPVDGVFRSMPFENDTNDPTA